MNNNSFIPDTHQSFLEHVDVPDTNPEDCWEWKGRRVLCSEGLIAAIGLHPGAPVVAASKRAFELFNGPIPDGMKIEHSCENPNCVNPDHLRLISIEAAEQKTRSPENNLIHRSSVMKMRNRILAGAQAKPAPAGKNYRAVKTIRAGRHQYLKFEG